MLGRRCIRPVLRTPCGARFINPSGGSSDDNFVPTHAVPRRMTKVHMMAPPVKTAPGMNYGAETAQSRQRAALSAMNFEELGVGGMDAKLATVFRRTFASRLIAPAVADKLAIRHTKGLLIHGPPGTGKTLLARKLAKVLGARPPKLVNGPEVFQKVWKRRCRCRCRCRCRYRCRCRCRCPQERAQAKLTLCPPPPSSRPPSS